MERPTINTIVTDKSCVAQHQEVSTTSMDFKNGTSLTIVAG